MKISAMWTYMYKTEDRQRYLELNQLVINYPLWITRISQAWLNGTWGTAGFPSRFDSVMYTIIPWTNSCIMCQTGSALLLCTYWLFSFSQRLWLKWNDLFVANILHNKCMYLCVYTFVCEWFTAGAIVFYVSRAVSVQKPRCAAVDETIQQVCRHLRTQHIWFTHHLMSYLYGSCDVESNATTCR